MKWEDRPPRAHPGERSPAGDRGARGRRGPPRSAQADPRAEAYAAKVAEIARTTGLPLEAARRVASGQANVNDLLKRMAFQDEVNSLMQRHALNRALATQVALGQASLDHILLRRRLEAHLVANHGRCVLEMALHGGGGLAPGAELTLGLHGHRNLRVKVQAVDPYEVVVREVEGGAEERIHKLQIKYAYPSAEHKKVRKGLEYDKERRDRAVEPIARPQHRFACSDKRLGFAMEQKHAVTAVTLEGECFTGEIAWISRYEFAIRTRHGGEVVVFRHALDDLRDARAA